MYIPSIVDAAVAVVRPFDDFRVMRRRIHRKICFEIGMHDFFRAIIRETPATNTFLSALTTADTTMPSNEFHPGQIAEELSDKAADILVVLKEHDGTADTTEIREAMGVHRSIVHDHRIRHLEPANLVAVEPRDHSKVQGPKHPSLHQLTERGEQVVEIVEQDRRRAMTVDARLDDLEDRVDDIEDTVETVVDEDIPEMQDDIDEILNHIHELWQRTDRLDRQA